MRGTMQGCEAPPRISQHHYRRTRKRIHAVCTAIFLALPFFNVMRFDIPRQRFYFFGSELWISEFAIIFFSLMFLMFAIVASSLVFGRVYCGYACPQMIFSETSIQLEDWLKRKINKHWTDLTAAARRWLWRLAFYAIVGSVSVLLAFAFTAYFVEPRDLFGRLLHFDMHTAGGITGVTVTLLTFLDFTLVRQRFCTTVCPYGYLQGMLGDGNTLLVQYRDPNHACIECKKCVRVCHMGIDIREGPLQIECVHCGECIDACDRILGRLNKPGLIHYVWGESGGVVEAETRWYRKLGIRDAKRVIILLITLAYLGGLATALSMRREVLVQLSPDRITLYRSAPDGVVTNEFRVKISNRSRKPARVFLATSGLPGARLLLRENPVTVAPGFTVEQRFPIAVSPFPGAQDVNHFQISVEAAPVGERETFDETFLMPPKGKTP